MNLLAIDTSTKNLSLAIARDKKIIRYRNVKLHRPLSFSIMPSIEKILKESEFGVNYRALSMKKGQELEIKIKLEK